MAVNKISNLMEVKLVFYETRFLNPLSTLRAFTEQRRRTEIIRKIYLLVMD